MRTLLFWSPIPPVLPPLSLVACRLSLVAEQLVLWGEPIAQGAASPILHITISNVMYPITVRRFRIA